MLGLVNVFGKPSKHSESSMRQAHPQQVRQAPGVISAEDLYTLDELKARLRWTDSSLRSARRHGLQLLGFGKRRFAAGSEVLRFLHSQSTTQPYKN